ncbi:MAG: glycosyltransferase [Clostridia bacterium]|nr:glycosyltransferase [Clostridia bacterium]
MKSIAILVLHLQHGGIERQTVSLANELAKSYSVSIISTYSMLAPPAYEISPDVSVRYLIDGKPNREEFLNCVRSGRVFSALKEGLRSVSILRRKKRLMIREVKKTASDGLFSTRLEFARILSRHAPKGVVRITQEHVCRMSGKYAKSVSDAMNGIDRLVVMTEAAREFYSSCLGKNGRTEISVIPNFTDMPRERASLLGRHVIAVGRLHPEKNLGALVEAFSKVAKKIPDADLTIVGDGPERKMLEDMALSLGISDRFRITGMVSGPETEKIMRDSDIMVMTSREECFPMVIIEAFSSGLPVVAFDVPFGPHSMIIDGHNGILVPFGDTDRMASEIACLLEDRQRLESIGKNALDSSAQYSKEAVMPLWKAFFG